jgi:RHS repeat-associated protein
MTARLPITLTRTYGAYGANSGNPGSARTAYAGEMREADTGWYLLGERPYSPTLRRFLAPDYASPVDGGGVNRYAYCGGDPVNRIDPSGHTWLGWLRASLGMSGAVGAGRSVAPTSRMHEAASTPTVVTSAAAAVTDTVSITAAIDSVALMTVDQQPSDGLFGWVAMGAKVASGGSSLPAARDGSPSQRFLGQQQVTAQRGRAGAKPKRDVEVVTDPHIPAQRLTTNRFGNPALERQWMFGPHHGNPYSVIWAADTVVAGEDFTKVFQLLARVGATNVNVYTGAHSEPYGRNWHLRTGERLDVDPSFFLEDLVHTKRAAKAVGVTITPINMGLLTKQQMQHHLLRDGVHLIGSCFGLSDEVVMEALNLRQVTVYDLF